MPDLRGSRDSAERDLGCPKNWWCCLEFGRGPEVEGRRRPARDDSQYCFTCILRSLAPYLCHLHGSLDIQSLLFLSQGWSQHIDRGRVLARPRMQSITKLLSSLRS